MFAQFTVIFGLYDLLKAKNYLFGSIQFSRGCPFQCEFCDIPITFGRKPRLKTTAQVIAELDAMRKQRIQIAFIVDDNLIGTIAVKKLLRDVAAWQAAKGYPFTFVCYASLNLAEDDEMLELMDAANIAMVFIGIESPNEESLHETKKYQNLRKSATIVDRVRKVQDSGLEVLCGMIVGFDHDDPQIFKAHYEFIRQTDIMHPTVNMLVAIPKTPLYARLKNDGRLDLSDTNPSDGMFGTNVIPLGMTRDELRDGYNGLVRDLHDPEFYFERLENLYLRRRFNFARTRNAYWRRHPWVKRKSQSVDALGAIVLFLRLMRKVPDPELRRIYRRRMTTMLRHRPDPTVLWVRFPAAPLKTRSGDMKAAAWARRSTLFRRRAFAFVDDEENERHGQQPRGHPDRMQPPHTGGECAGDRAGGKRSDHAGVNHERSPGTAVLLHQEVVSGFNQPHQIAGGGQRHVCEVADAAKQANLDAGQEGDRHHNQAVGQRCGQESEPGQDGRLARHSPSQRLRHHFVDSTGLDM